MRSAARVKGLSNDPIHELNTRNQWQIDAERAPNAEEPLDILRQAGPLKGRASTDAVVWVCRSLSRESHCTSDLLGVDLKFLTKPPHLIPKADLGRVESIMSDLDDFGDNGIVIGSQISTERCEQLAEVGKRFSITASQDRHPGGEHVLLGRSFSQEFWRVGNEKVLIDEFAREAFQRRDDHLIAGTGGTVEQITTT